MNEMDQFRSKRALFSENSTKSERVRQFLSLFSKGAHKYSYKRIFVKLYSDIFFESLKWWGACGPYASLNEAPAFISAINRCKPALPRLATQ